MRYLTSALLGILLAAGLSVGCQGPLVDAVPTTLVDINRIVNDTGLSGQQKREALADLGLSPLIINSLLRSTRESNQFGGDLRSAYNKVTTGHLDQLTPDELQVYGDAVGDVDEDLAHRLSDEEAQAIADFFDQYGISTKDQLIDILNDPAIMASISATIPDNVLSNFFVDFDPAKLIDQLP